MSDTRNVLLVGATQGLGLNLAERYLVDGWRVVATTLHQSGGLATLAEKYGDALEIVTLDITDRAAVETLREAMAERRFDVLHIVEGMMPPPRGAIWEHDGAEILKVLETNAIGGVRLATLFADLVPEGGTFAFTSSGMGSMTRNDRGGVDLYRVSKATLNMLVRSFSATTGTGRAVVLICPGWAKTEMGGPDATVEVRDSVEGIYRIVSTAKPTPGGAPFIEYSGEAVPW